MRASVPMNSAIARRERGYIKAPLLVQGSRLELHGILL
jgi:hypothetical protein